MKFLTILLMCILCGVEVDLFIPSFPELQKVFGLSPFMVQMTLSINFCAYCISSLLAGTLGDKYNRRTIILLGLLLFVIGSILCVTATNFPLLLLGRFLQGAGVAGPAVLAYVVVADEYPIEKQAQLMGIFNGLTSLAMTCAPLIGSYVNLYYDWHGNFTILLILGIICFILAFLYIPLSKNSNSSIIKDNSSYKDLLSHNKSLIYIISFCCLVSPYWIYVGMAPILFMEDMGVSLKNFGFYQGALCITFGTISLASSRILSLFGQKKCFYTSIIMCIISSAFILTIGVTNLHNPKFITLMLMFFSASVVFPINILYPNALDAVPNAKGKMSALISATRLILVSIGLEVVAYYHNGNFLNISILMTCFILVFLYSIYILINKKWLNFSS